MLTRQWAAAHRCFVLQLLASSFIASLAFEASSASYLRTQRFPDAPLQPSNGTATGEGPPMFVAVFSARENFARRHAIRASMRRAGTKTAGRVFARFVLCYNDDAARPGVQKESAENDDLLFMPCEEGLDRTFLTKKLLAVLRIYHKDFAKDRPIFMRVDDDTFVAWKRLQSFLGTHKGGLEYAYMGVTVPAGHFVNRDPSSPWYQPESSYPAKWYPIYMEKGPGYLLGRSLVARILEEGVADSNILSNEDQAVGVWVNKAKLKLDLLVSYVTLPGTHNYKPPTSDHQRRTWGDYPFLLHHQLKGDVISCLAQVDADEQPDAGIDHCFVDTMFIAVFSARANEHRRSLVRKMFQSADEGSGRVMAKFAVCSDANDGLDKALQQEGAAFGDLLMLDCEEGYVRTKLTKKLLLAMREYRHQYSDRSLFMKVDDDTFVAWKRLLPFIAGRMEIEYAYMGVPAPEDMKVNRDPESPWYQPLETYSQETYPSNMEGGPGYIMGWDLVRRILDDGIAERNLLSNEDQAAGVWVDKLRKNGVPVHYVSIPGTDGYRPEYDACYGKWKDYQFMLHHHLQPDIIACLAKVDAEDDMDVSIDHCFADCVSLTTAGLEGKLDMVGGEVQKAISKLQGMKRLITEARSSIRWLSMRAASKHVGNVVAQAVTATASVGELVGNRSTSGMDSQAL